MPGRVNKRVRTTFTLTLSLILIAGLWTAAAASLAVEQEELSPPQHRGMEAAKRNLGPNACGECHIAELESWNQSAHAVGYAEMHRSEAAKTIGKNLGIRRIKREASCIRCHYSEAAEDDSAKVVTGVSCESCHGPAKEWMPLHDDFGGAGVAKGDESAAHRAERRDRAIAAGMHRPDDLYHLAASCFRCHVMDDAEVVEKGGHPIGADFELLAYSQGEVRHNFMASDGKANAEPSAERRRLIYALGQFLDLEYSLRALASTAAAGAHADALAARIKTTEAKLKAMAELVDLAELNEVVPLVAGLELKPAAPALNPAIAKVASLGRQFAKRDGSALAALEALLPKASAFKGKALN